MTSTVIPFQIAIPDDVLGDLRERLRRTRWPEAPTVPDWSQGVPLEDVRALCAHWADGYDWRAREALLNRYPQYRTELDGLLIHFLHVPSPEPEALPLVITHGWPGSIVEMMDVIGPLSDPVAHGGEAADAFHVVVPSLPGYGWSDKPTAPGWGVERIARAWALLMTRLGYDRFGAQGGDWGSAVTTALAQQSGERLAGIHVNFAGAGPAPGQTDFAPEEQRALEAIRHYTRWESGYSQQQSTRPQTLGYGLTDSPAGQCAWILEKLWAWSDCDGDPVGLFGADRILDNVMLYWLPAAAASSARLYWESFGRFAAGLGAVEVPAGYSSFPKEIFCPPRHWVERIYTDLRMWHELDRGGHFAAFEQPELFVAEVRELFRLVR
jgi:pimeloyl-ACP methyl ester carboxylesterase